MGTVAPGYQRYSQTVWICPSLREPLPVAVCAHLAQFANLAPPSGAYRSRLPIFRGAPVEVSPC
jgi:hypothetical protein